MRVVEGIVGGKAQGHLITFCHPRSAVDRLQAMQWDEREKRVKKERKERFELILDSA